MSTTPRPPASRPITPSAYELAAATARRQREAIKRDLYERSGWHAHRTPTVHQVLEAAVDAVVEREQRIAHLETAVAALTKES